MFQLLKRLTAALCVGCLLLTGCNASEEEQTVTEEKIEISDAYEDMEVYARFYFYNNYSSIVAEYGEEQLPIVEDVTVSDVQATQITYGDTTYDGYEVSVTITYGDTQAQDLKTSAVLSIAKMEDYDHDTLTAINNGELGEVPLPKTLMRVIALA